MEEQQTGEYQANDADAIIGEIFSGGITVAEAIERRRTRLLDLSSRNRLLNYRHPKGRSVQIADNPNLNLVFDRLMDSKSVPFRYVPEPDPDSYEGKRPEAKLHAARLGISTAFEFPPNPEGANGHRLHGIQTLLYPADLERLLRKIASEAKTAIEETGSNMLFLVFGFLEFYDSDDSDRAMIAPLLSLPVTLAKGGLDRDTRTYQYSVLHSGEDLAENHTLREKMRRDFILTLPEYEEEEEPESYFALIEQAISKKRRWKVRRQITLGMLSFGKLAIWADLDSKKNPGLLQSELVKSVFSGGEGGSGGLHAEDYRIDERLEAAQPLIFDADSSQHSAIIDVLSGKNMVVNGPREPASRRPSPTSSPPPCPRARRCCSSPRNWRHSRWCVTASTMPASAISASNCIRTRRRRRSSSRTSWPASSSGSRPPRSSRPRWPRCSGRKPNSPAMPS